MQQKSGSWTRSLTAIGLAIGISFSGATSLGVYADDNDDLDSASAYLYEGNTSDIENARMIIEIDDLDDYYDDWDDDRDDRDDRGIGGNRFDDDRDDDRYDDDRDDDDWDDDDWDDDDWDDDDWDDDDWDDDDWDDDDWDDDDWDDDDWDDDDWDDDDWDDDDWDDDDWDDDDWDDDDWDDDDWDDDWDDDDWDDDDDDDWDDFSGSRVKLNTSNANLLVHSMQLDEDDDHWTVLGNGDERPEILLTTEDEIDDDHALTVQSLVDGQYMIVVHEDGDTDSPIVAAGNISGIVEDGTILVELQEVNDSGFEGRAHIAPEDDDLYELDVTVGIFPVGSVTPLNTPAPRG